MNKYENGNLVIYSDFEIRKLREDKGDIDLLIPLDMRVLNIHMDDMPKYIDDRFQFSEVRNIIVRFTTSVENDYCTIHLLRSIDLNSAIVNFSMNYKEYNIKIIKSDFNAEMYLQDIKEVKCKS
ncbi:hypothetical protein [Tissierella sp. Yu-01]|uniref:hypothetical protein n=1 Tax=Tissierella sp. Yu-01 TaxID=3035694 RepID=UPI00240E3151|nr:hypothetical protein [Tissierella sp. Yu-01]WFA07789.1 hypothetical protein P3962_08585 [Tissierella sp. Yu-01]